MIREDYISFEAAKLLKEKGFDLHDTKELYVAYKDGYCVINNSHTKHYPTDEFPKATHQMVLKWLRDIHNLDIIAPPQFDNSKWTYSAIIFKLSIPCTEIRLNDNKDKKEEAYEAAIKYCLTNLIK